MTLTVVSSHPDGCSDGKVSFSFSQDGAPIKTSTFCVPSDFTISGDLAAAAAIAMRPIDAAVVRFNFPVSPRAKAIAARDYKITVEAPDGPPPLVRPAGNCYLNFSGGVDSLAAHQALKSDARLLSVDFGGNFKREADWFRTFDTFVVETDLRNKPFHERDWRFMAAGAMLFAEYLHIGSLFFGTILEAAPYWLSNVVKRSPETYEPTHAFGMAGMRLCQSVSPVSEYGTTKLALAFGSDALSRSIDSCASPGTEKYFRKLVLRSLAEGHDWPSAEVMAHTPKKRHVLGSAFSPDVLTAYFVWRYGADFVSEYIADLSPEAQSGLSELDMSFIERYNPANLPSIPAAQREMVVAEYERCGLAPYTSADKQALEQCRTFMGRFHKF